MPHARVEQPARETGSERGTPPGCRVVGPRAPVGPGSPVPAGLLHVQQTAGNRAAASLLAGARKAAVQRVPADVAQVFNPQDAAHRLVEAIDQKQVKSMVPPLQRHVDFPVVVNALKDRTAAQIDAIDKAYRNVEDRSIATDVLGGGESHFPTDLTPAQQARVRALLAGTVGDGAGRQADADAALHRLDATAAELHTLLHGDLDAAAVEAVMAVLRRPAARNADVAAHYQAQFHTELRYDLSALPPHQAVRAHLLLSGATAVADSAAVAADRARITAIDQEIAHVRESGGLEVVRTAKIDHLRKQRRAAVGEVEGRVAQVAADARAEDRPGSSAAEQAVRKEILHDADAGLTGADATAVRAVADDDPAARAGAHLIGLREAGEVTAAAIASILRELREQAEAQVKNELRQADAAAIATAARTRATGWMRRVESVYDAGRPAGTPSFGELLGGTGDLSEVLHNQALRFGGGRLDPVSELRYALAGDHKDLETVKRVLHDLPGAEITKIRREFPDLDEQLFGRVGQDHDPVEIAGIIAPTAGKAAGADRLELEDYLQRPEHEGGLEEALYLRNRAEREYRYAIDNGGFTGWWRDHWGNEARTLMDESIRNIRAEFTTFVAGGAKDAERLQEMRRWRATIRGDRVGYEKATAELRATFEAFVEFALQAALTALLTPAAAWAFRGLEAAEAGAAAIRTAKYVRGLLVNTVTTVASHAAVEEHYGLDGLRRDLMGTLTGALGSAGASKFFGAFGEAFINSVAGKEIIAAASTVAAIEANALAEGHSLTADQLIQNLLITHGQGKVLHAVGERSEKAFGPRSAAGGTPQEPAPPERWPEGSGSWEKPEPRPEGSGPIPVDEEITGRHERPEIDEEPTGRWERPSDRVPEPIHDEPSTHPHVDPDAPLIEESPEGGFEPTTQEPVPEDHGPEPPQEEIDLDRIGEVPDDERPTDGGGPGETSRPRSPGEARMGVTPGAGPPGPSGRGSAPGPASRTHPAGDVVEVRFDYGEERYHRNPPPSPPSRPPRYLGHARYDAVRVVEGDVAYKELTVRLHLDPGAGVTDAHLAAMRENTLLAVEGLYNDPRHVLIDGDVLRVRVEFIDDPLAAHLIISAERARPGTVGRDDQLTWYVGSDPIVHAHEVGHHLGLIDEYVESSAEPVPSRSRDTPGAPGVRPGRSVMGGIFEALGFPTADPGSRVEQRHLDEVADAVAEQKLRNELTARGVDLTPGVPDNASLRATDYDATGPNGEFQILAPDATEAGMAALESRLMMLRYQASRHRVGAEAIFRPTTPPAVLQMARHILGNAHVHLR